MNAALIDRENPHFVAAIRGCDEVDRIAGGLKPQAQARDDLDFTVATQQERHIHGRLRSRRMVRLDKDEVSPTFGNRLDERGERELLAPMDHHDVGAVHIVKVRQNGRHYRCAGFRRPADHAGECASGFFRKRAAPAVFFTYIDH